MASLLRALRARPPLAAALLVLVVLLGTTDERSFGLIPDGQQMLSAGAAAALGGEIGVSRDFANAVPREGGDAFSRYGMGQSLVEVPFLWAALALHAVSPGLSSAPVLALLPLLCLAAVAWGVARAAGHAGASSGAQRIAGVAVVLATPLWGYAGSDFSEPLQAALVALGLAALGAYREAPSRRAAFLAGLLAGSLPLVKSLLWIVAVPLLAVAARPRAAEAAKPTKGGRAKRLPRPPSFLPALALGAAVPAALWLALELVRFGGPFGGYPGEDFSYPFLTGLLRLTLFPNKGILVYAPFVLLAIPGFFALRRRDPALALGAGIAALAVLASASAWWAWDGQAAWGPRLVLPALPLVFVAGSLSLDSGAPWRRAGLALAVAGVLVNLPGTLQPFAPVYALVSAAPSQPIPVRRAAGTPYEIARRPDGVLVATPPHHLSLSPGWWPPLVHARLLGERVAGGDVAGRLAAGALDLTPRLAPVPRREEAGATAQAVSPFTWPIWGRSFLSPPPGSLDPLSLALKDQAVRDLDTGRLPRARRRFAMLLAREGARPAPRTLALAADAAARAGDAEEAARLLGLSPEPCHPWVLYVRAGRGEDVSACVPAAHRAGFLSSVETARRLGRTVSGWAREAARPAGAG
jgi:hypothetical protein